MDVEFTVEEDVVIVVAWIDVLTTPSVEGVDRPARNIWHQVHSKSKQAIRIRVGGVQRDVKLYVSLQGRLIIYVPPALITADMDIPPFRFYECYLLMKDAFDEYNPSRLYRRAP
ncbi:hypothetical protein C5167_013304 [Papaver somniferum]|uniref:Uncharacterized protein n=1 Tax=Papaver somniferum TaxID=3469 RepID=A0A4Y7IZX3_PAPSO|nr:hypothetical protein C5167_013304 [Papaver somniferum]